MPALTPPGLTLARCGSVLVAAVAIVTLALPMIIATVALAPALAICPFLSAAHRRFVTSLLGSLQQWALALTTACTRAIPPNAPRRLAG